MQQKEPSKHSRIASSGLWAQPTPTSPSSYGISSPHRCKTTLTYFFAPAYTLTVQPTKPLKACMTGTGTQWHPPEQWRPYIKIPIPVHRGHLTALTPGSSAHPRTTTDVICITSQKPVAIGFQDQPTSSPNIAAHRPTCTKLTFRN